MKYAVWLLVIGFAASALIGGYLSGRAAVPRLAPPARRASRGDRLPADLLTGPASVDEVAGDAFARDPAVVAEGPAAGMRHDARLAIVVVNAGYSPVLEAPFLSMGMPVALVIDPRAPAAHRMLRLARRSGNEAYLQVHRPLRAAPLRRLLRAFRGVRGVALRMRGRQAVTSRALAVLRHANLAVFDEYGGDRPQAGALSAAGVRYAARGITVDDHLLYGYVAYMLRQAVRLARGGTVVVMARPFPGNLQAFRDLRTHAARDGVRFVGL